ncbi:MAG TPA: helix-turn-helix transcriptional regulator [Actinotalea sp.]
MDTRGEVKAFLTSRRAKLTPEQVGLSGTGRNRRVPGLRRGEVADLAGVSVEYYARLERGDLSGVSDSVLDALARALELDEAERLHLADLARSAGPAARTRRRPSTRQLRPSLQRVLDGMTDVPAIVNGPRLDLMAANALGRALFAPVLADPDRPANHARFTFLDPRARDFWLHWERAADDAVASLRTQAGRDPYDRELTDLVGELCTRSEAFRTRWASHDVRLHGTGVKHLHHPVVGDLHLSFDVMELPADGDLTLIAFTAEPASPDEDALRLLAGWAVDHDREGAPVVRRP